MKLKILQQSPKLLKMSLKPQTVLYWLFGGIFIVGGIFLITSLGKATTFTCKRTTSTQGNCQLIVQSLFHSDVKNWEFQELKGAKLDTNKTDEWGSYSLVLLTTSGSVPINLMNADSTQKDEKAKQINAIIQNPQLAKLDIREDSRFWAYLLGLFLAFTGAICIIYSLINNQILCILDKNLNKVTIERQGVFNKEILEGKLSDIVGVDIDIFTVEDSSSYNVALSMKDENKIYLAIGPMFTAKTAEQVVNVIANFLNILY